MISKFFFLLWNYFPKVLSVTEFDASSCENFTQAVNHTNSSHCDSSACQTIRLIRPHSIGHRICSNSVKIWLEKFGCERTTQAVSLKLWAPKEVRTAGGLRDCWSALISRRTQGIHRRPIVCIANLWHRSLNSFPAQPSRQVHGSGKVFAWHFPVDSMLKVR